MVLDAPKNLIKMNVPASHPQKSLSQEVRESVYFTNFPGDFDLGGQGSYFKGCFPRLWKLDVPQLKKYRRSGHQPSEKCLGSWHFFFVTTFECLEWENFIWICNLGFLECIERTLGQGQGRSRKKIRGMSSCPLSLYTHPKSSSVLGSQDTRSRDVLIVINQYNPICGILATGWFRLYLH